MKSNFEPSWNNLEYVRAEIMSLNRFELLLGTSENSTIGPCFDPNMVR